MKKLLSILLVSVILFGCGSPYTKIEKTTDTKVLDYRTSDNYPYQTNLYLLYFGPMNINGIKSQIRNIHKLFKEEVHIWVYLSEEGYNCYERILKVKMKFDEDCLEYKDDLLLISKKSKLRNLNYMKLMKQNGELGEFRNKEYEL